MELYFLGTGAGMPSRRRNVTSIALNLLDEIGAYWLFDCGEGTQHQILKSPVRLSRLQKVFITHLHGDHVYGIPGLLTSRSNQGGESPLTVYGPRGIKALIETVLELSQARLSYELEIVEMSEGVLFDDGTYRVEAAKLRHRIECFGFRITEKDKEGRLDADRLKTMGVPPGPLYGELKRGKSILLPDGREVSGTDVMGPPTPGRIVTILGDTVPTEASVELSRGADILVHEATFDAEKADLAEQFFHSTCVDAAETARIANARALILTHISSRYGEEDTETLLQAAKAVFPNAYAAEDFWSFPVPLREPLQTES